MPASLNNLAILVNLMVALGTLLTALFTLRAARAASEATNKTHKATQTQVITSLHDEYHSEEMRKAIHTLKDLLAKYKDTYPEEFKKQRSSHPTWDSSRRRVSRYFEKICILHENELLDYEFIEAVANRDQVSMLLTLVKPLAKQINPKTKLTCYNMLKDYHKIDESKIIRVR